MNASRPRSFRLPQGFVAKRAGGRNVHPGFKRHKCDNPPGQRAVRAGLPFHTSGRLKNVERKPSRSTLIAQKPASNWANMKIVLSLLATPSTDKENVSRHERR